MCLTLMLNIHLFNKNSQSHVKQYQLVQDHMEDGGWFNSKNVFIKDTDLQNRMLDVFGMYWHIIVKVKTYSLVPILNWDHLIRLIYILTFQIMILFR